MRSPTGSRRSRSPRRSSSRRSRSRSRSPRRSSTRRSPDRRDRSRPDRPRSPDRRDRQKGKRYQWGRAEDNEPKEEEVVEVSKPDFGLSGKLAAETNTVNGVELKYNEPPEASKPNQKWRLYVFKGKEQIDLLHIHRQSHYLIGRDRAVADIPIDHPSCSKQHAVIQYRLTTERDDNGKPIKVTKPYLIDLEATNGTFINGEKIPATRYVELKTTDMIKFGTSTREYVLIRPE